MAVYKPVENPQEAPACFLCELDPDTHPCAVPRLEGLVIAAHVTMLDGEAVPWVTLKMGDAFASITLSRYYREMVKGLRALGGSLEKYQLTLRVYHLSPAINTTTHHDRHVDRYRANSYTLAVLEPETMLNITDLNQAEYCARQYLLGRLAPSGGSPAALRGNLVHHCFKELLKEQDRRRYMRGKDEASDEEPLSILRRHLESELAQSRIDLALLNTSAETMRAEVAPHLESLANWFSKQRATLWDLPVERTEENETNKSDNTVRAETFLLAPEIGLRGRLDLLWQQSGRRRLLELKTGGATGELPRSAHKWQVQGYHALLTVRRESRMKKALATLLYSGTPQQAQDFGIPFTVRQLQQVNATRNLLVLSHVTGVPPAPPGTSRCSRCALQDQCVQVSALLNWQPPALPVPESGSEAVGDGDEPEATSMNEPDRSVEALEEVLPIDREFFATYYRLLRQEGREIEKQQASLWQTTVEERVARGSAISGLIPLGGPRSTNQGEWEQTFRCLNTSELREGDEVLLSDGNPVTGEVVTGTILSVSSEQVTVWLPELIARPSLLDRYDTSIVHVRTVQNLLRWLSVNERQRRLVNGTFLPRFTTQTVAPRPDFNDEQNLAVTRALQMQDYLLIHGPPGTGKTSVIAEIVKRLCQQGQRVLLAAFTNQAVDNMLMRLEREGFHEYIRLGHERSINETVRHRLLQTLSRGDLPAGSPRATSEIRAMLSNSQVVASTTATWSSDKYMPGPVDNQQEGESALLQFDVALIDEAGQLTIPAILGALRFAKRFILVGDERQLPPLVLSKEAGNAGLAISLFSKLKRQDESQVQKQEREISACVPLKVQYRMHEVISAFASRTFYRGQLRPHYSVARRRLSLVKALPGSVSSHQAILSALRVDLPMVFLDVRGEEHQAESKLSNAEARAVRDVIAGLLARGITEDEIGVIAPYRAQVANLSRHLFSDDEASHWSALSVETPLSIDTVDRFQGGERSIIIISFATSVTPSAESQLREH
ncbi:MAG TPA: AAA domain-containing protein, partial [Ktedonobacteraceae bacterium]|nr:AAA domain-containing protein [Ktedonobacteraceae bacterium]